MTGIGVEQQAGLEGDTQKLCEDSNPICVSTDADNIMCVMDASNTYANLVFNPNSTVF